MAIPRLTNLKKNLIFCPAQIKREQNDFLYCYDYALLEFNFFFLFSKRIDRDYIIDDHETELVTTKRFVFAG